MNKYQYLICTNVVMTLFIGIHFAVHYGAIFKVDVKGKQTMYSNDLGFLLFQAVNISVAVSQITENKWYLDLQRNIRNSTVYRGCTFY